MELEGRRDGKEEWGDILVSPVPTDACARDSSDTAVGAVEGGADWALLSLGFNAASHIEGCWLDAAAKNDWSTGLMVWTRASQCQSRKQKARIQVALSTK